MPRLNPAHQTVHERIAARRVQHERTAQGWTVDEMADRLVRVGYPLGRTAIYKIESGARRISVDELMAFAKALGLDVGKLVMPVDAAVQKLMPVYAKARERRDRAEQDVRKLEDRLMALADEDEALVLELLEQHPGGELLAWSLPYWRVRTGRMSLEEFAAWRLSIEPPPPGGPDGWRAEFDDAGEVLWIRDKQGQDA